MFTNTKSTKKCAIAILLAALFAVQILLASCGGGSASMAQSAPPAPAATTNPAPTASSISPAKATAGTAGVQITIDGANFVSSAVVTWNGTNLSTTFVNSSQVKANVPQSALVAAGTAQVQVANPAPGGGSCSALVFTIENVTPSIAALSPASVVKGATGVTLAVDGTGFASGATIQWNGTQLTTTVVNPAQVTAAVPDAAFASAGVSQVTVQNPPPGGGTSNAISFTVENPLPAIASISPNSAPAGSASFSLTVIGSGFLSNSSVAWNGSPLVTVFVSPAQLTVTVPASALTAGGNFNIQITNTTPGGGTSNQAVFSVLHGSPVITSINPATAPAASSPFTMTISGSGFSAGASVEWNGLPLATTFVSSTTLQASVSANELSAIGVFTVRAANPAPGGGYSSALNFTVGNGVPTLNSSSRTNACAGDTGFTITVDGANFVPGSVVLWDGAALQTTFMSTTQLTAEVTADKIARAVTRQLMIWNPPPSGGFSNSLAFVIDPVTSTFVYVAQPADGLISRLVVDPISKRLRPDGYDYVMPSGSALWALHLHRSRKFLYTLDFSNNQVLGFSINAVTGELKAIPGASVPTGTEPVYVTSHSSGKYLYVANLSSGDVSGYSVDQNSGALQALPGSPFAAGTYPLGITTDDAGKFVFVTNYGSSSISAYTVSPSGSLVPVPGSPFAAAGSGPWTPALDPSGKFLFVPNYDSVDVSVYSINSITGSLSTVSGSPYAIGTFPAYVTIDPGGRFLYVTDFNDNIQGLMHILAVDPATGQLSASAASPVAAGTSPNRLMFSNSGLRAFLTNYSSWDLMVFDVSPQDGSLSLAEQLPTHVDPENIAIVEGATPYSVAPKFAYVAQPASNQISVFQVDPASGIISVPQAVNSVTADALAVHPSSGFIYSLTKQTGILTAFQANPNDGALSPAAVGTISAGSDPRALLFEPTKRFAYVLNKSVGKISHYRVDPSTGAFTLQNEFAIGSEPSSMAMGPTGRYLYVAFSDTGEVKVFEITATDGTLGQPSTLNVGTQGPSQVATDPYGKFLAAVFPSLGEVRLYEIFAPTGALNYNSTVFPGASPAAVAFDPSGKFLLVAASATNTLSAYLLDRANGQLQATATVPTGNTPAFVAIDPSNKFVYVGNSGSSDISIYRFDPQSGSLQIITTTVLASPARQVLMVGGAN